MDENNKISHYNLRFFLLVCLFLVTFQMHGPTGPKKYKMERKGKGFGHGITDSTKGCLHNFSL